MKRTPEQIYELVNKLHRVPHLKLPFKFDVSLIQKEMSSILKWTPHSHAGFKQMSPEDMTYYSKGYSGVSLYEYNGQANYATDNYEIYNNTEPGVTYDKVTGKVLFLATELTAKMPYTKSVIDKISLRKGRTRIMRSDPDHSIVWHSHNRGPWFNEFMQEAIIHIPIITDPLVLHTVRDYRHPDSQIEKGTSVSYSRLMESSDVYRQHYEAGDCWLFNSWHDHYYHNYSSITRYTLLFYIRWFDNEDFVNLIEEALKSYTGPLINTDLNEQVATQDNKL